MKMKVFCIIHVQIIVHNSFSHLDIRGVGIGPAGPVLAGPLPYTSKQSRGKTFAVRAKMKIRRENFRGRSFL